MRDVSTGRSRGFGFVTFEDSEVVNTILAQEHIVDGKRVCPVDPLMEFNVFQIDPKPAIPPGAPKPAPATRQFNQSHQQNDNTDTADDAGKIFVGGIHHSVTEMEFKDFFSAFGRVASAQIMYDKTTGRSRGFGFLTFEDESTVEKVLKQGDLFLSGKLVPILRCSSSLTSRSK